MPIKPLALYTQFYASQAFSLSMRQEEYCTKIIMNLKHNSVNTRNIPLTVKLLKKTLPSVLKSICYNENNYPFSKEVRQTEIGHLFEHILIEYLCLIKISLGYDDVEYSGLTKWNWFTYPRGSFHITVSAGSNDGLLFKEAMNRTIYLTQEILFSANTALIPPVTPNNSFTAFNSPLIS